MQTILFTGGGTAGHVTPNLPLIKYFQAQGWQVIYVGSEQGLEREIISKINIPYYSLTTDKLRRHFTWKNFLSPFKVLLGIAQAYNLCRRLKPQILFSKGGFVAFPVVFGAWLNRIPVVAHESDLTPGLANRLSFPFAKRICVTFTEGTKYFGNNKKVVVTGTPIRPELITGNAEKGRTLCGFQDNKPVILIFGGGQGAAFINQTIRRLLPQLLPQFQIIHLCGKGKTDPSLVNVAGYKQFEYLNEELADAMACADLVISRAGANSIYELLALKKPHILIPLSTKASRGDQIANAKYFAKQNLSHVIHEEELDDAKLLAMIQKVYQQKELIQTQLAAFTLPNSTQIIADLLLSLAQQRASHAYS